VCFRNGSVSKNHAVLSAQIDKAATLAEGEPIWLWQIVDRISTNGTFLESPGSPPYRIAPGVPYAIVEGSIIQFGSQAAKIKCSFDIDDTQSYERSHDTDPITGTSEGTSTDIKAPKGAADSPWFVPIILEPAWVWFVAQHPLFQALILAMMAGLLALWIHKN
jgi:hypothetical protein